MFPFKQIKSSLSHQNLPHSLPPAYPTSINSQSQLQIRRERINPVGQYEHQPRSAENLTEIRDIYTQTNPNGQPLTFNINPNYKNKIKKGSRPLSRGPSKLTQGLSSQRGQVQQFRVQQRGYSRENLQDYSRMTSTIITGFNLQTIQHYQNTKTQKTPEKVYLQVRGRPETQANWTPFEKARQENLEMTVLPKTSPKINFVHPIPNQHYAQNAEKRTLMPHETYMLQDIKNQQQTIENFQRQVVRLNTEIRELRNSNQHLMRQYDEIAKEMRIQSQRSLEESRAEWHKQQYLKLSAEVQTMEKELSSKTSMIAYWEQQCNLCNESYKKGVLEIKKNKEEHQAQVSQLTATINQLKKETEERRITEINLKQSQNLIKEKEAQIQNLKKLIQTQIEKLQKQQHNILIDRSQINILMMKLQSFQAKNQQLSIELQQNSKKYQEDIIKQRQLKIEQLTKYELLVHEKTSELMNAEQECRALKEQYWRIKEMYQEAERQKKDVQGHLQDLKQQFQDKNRMKTNQNKRIIEANQAQEVLISQYKAEIDRFIEKEKQKGAFFKHNQQRIKELNQQCKFLTQENALLLKKLAEYQQSSQKDNHILCREMISDSQKELRLTNTEKQAWIRQLETISAENKDFEIQLKRRNQQYNQMEVKCKNLAEENIKLVHENTRFNEESVRLAEKNIRLAEENARLAEENVRLDEEIRLKLDEKLQRYKQIQQQSIRLRHTLLKYEQLQLQARNMTQNLQKLKYHQSQNLIKLSQTQLKINELYQENHDHKWQIKELTVQLQNSLSELNITKNESTMLKSANRSSLEQIGELERRLEKANELIDELTNQRQITLYLTRQRDRLSQQISKEKQTALQQLVRQQEKYTQQLRKYMTLIEENQLHYESSLQSHKKSTQLLQIQLRELNQKLQQLQKSQSQGKQPFIQQSKEQVKVFSRSQKHISLSQKRITLSQKHISLSPSKPKNNQSDTSFVDYLQVDRQGLLYICELLGIEFIEGGILNRIVEQLQLTLGRWQLNKKHSDFYIEVLELFGIQPKENCNDLLLSEVKSIKDSLSFLIQRVREEQLKVGEANKNVQFLIKQSKLSNAKMNELKHYVQQLTLLNLQLNQKIMCASAKLYNQKLQTKMVLNIIEDGTGSSQNQISIFKSQPFYTIQSIKAISEDDNYETLL